MVFAPFWSETCIDFGHFGLESGIIFREQRWCINIFFDWRFQMNSKWISRDLFVGALILVMMI